MYDQVNASPTIHRDNGTFGFSYLDFHTSFAHFVKEAEPRIEAARNSTRLIPAVSGENVIHYSVIPWVDFSSLSHARHFKFADSSPKISFGKLVDQDARKTMAVSIHGHHALIDGQQVGRFVDEFQRLMNLDISNNS